MPSEMTPQQVSHIANLARLKISAEEAIEYAKTLSQVMQSFEQIAAIPTQGIEPLVTPTNIEAYWRPDEVIQTTTTEEIVANAPEKTGNLFTVPPVV